VKKIAPHVPVIDKSKRQDGTFSRTDFKFDKESNVYICPAGKMLTTTGRIHGDHAIRYFASYCTDGSEEIVVATFSQAS
jgi:hypothetical protein